MSTDGTLRLPAHFRTMATSATPVAASDETQCLDGDDSDIAIGNEPLIKDEAVSDVALEMFIVGDAVLQVLQEYRTSSPVLKKMNDGDFYGFGDDLTDTILNEIDALGDQGPHVKGCGVFVRERVQKALGMQETP